MNAWKNMNTPNKLTIIKLCIGGIGVNCYRTCVCAGIVAFELGAVNVANRTCVEVERATCAGCGVI